MRLGLLFLLCACAAAQPQARETQASGATPARQAAPQPVAPAAPKIAPKDSDGDGVPDADDLCPDVPGPAANHGCPVLADKDGDGVPDDVDRCPDVPGPKENFGCPFGDKDNDGVPDNEDKCPDVPGPKENAGCPYGDRDNDGVADNEDRCPDVPGPRENAGCPWADRDHDGVPDKDDRCPDEPGPAANGGCPRAQKLVVVRRDRIDLRRPIRFAPGGSTLLTGSYDVLRQVAQALKDAPHVQVRVEGHTDEAGRLASDMKLSQARAEAVKDFLVQQGVQERQLVAQGYGPTRPIASNATRAGKLANTRVELHIVSASP